MPAALSSSWNASCIPTPTMPSSPKPSANAPTKSMELTPVNSILFVGAFALGFGLLGIVGVGMQEAFQLLDNAAGIFYALTYMVLFAIPIFAARRIGLRAPLWLRVASVSGFLVSLLYIALTVFPIVEVVNPRAFAVKIIAVALVVNFAGAGVFYLGRRRQRAAATINT